jgi:gluconolactonase
MNPYVQCVPNCGLGEGPHWNADKNELYYVDISGQHVHRYVPGTGEHARVRIAQERVTLVVPVQGQENKYVIGVGRTLQLMDWDGRSATPTSLTTMYTVEPENPGNRWNDGKCDTRGRLWAGTMNDNLFTGNLYRVTNNIQTVIRDVGISNGIAWNKANTLMYYIDTPTRKVDVFDFNDEQGTISNRRTVYDFNTVGESGSPDGMNIDADDNLWVACWGGSQIIHVDPRTSRKIKAVPLPTNNITSIAFGGPNLDVMYVTSASDGLSDAQKADQPAAGCLFQITNTGARGQGGGNNFRY